MVGALPGADLATDLPVGAPSQGLRCRVVSDAANRWPEHSALWERVYGQVPDASPYLSATWVGQWLREFGRSLRPVLWVAEDAAGAPIGACLLTRRVLWNAVVPLRRLFLNTDGEASGDSVVVQHNRILAVPGAEVPVHSALASAGITAACDELTLSGLPEPEVDRFLEAFHGWRADVTWMEAPYVDLERMRSDGRHHLDLLSRNSREQLRRSLNRYRERGPLVLEAARTAEAAGSMFDELLALHGARWQAQGMAGGFAAPARLRFHRAFLRDAVPKGYAQLLRVTCGDTVVGVLYNLVANGRIMFYQSGLRFEEDARLKPGLVTHHLAIDHAREAGYTEYDFLVSPPGEGRYKRSLADRTRRLGWVSLYRPGWRNAYFGLARSLRDRWQRLGDAAPPGSGASP